MSGRITSGFPFYTSDPEYSTCIVYSLSKILVSSRDRSLFYVRPVIPLINSDSRRGLEVGVG